MDLAALKNAIRNHDGDYMDDEQTALYKQHLSGELNSARQALSERVTFDRESIKATDPADWASNKEIEEANERTDKALHRRVLATQSAMRAISLGDYGFCIDCGKEIGHDRLLSNPSALRDMLCESRAEHKQKTVYGR